MKMWSSLTKQIIIGDWFLTAQSPREGAELEEFDLPGGAYHLANNRDALQKPPGKVFIKLEYKKLMQHL